MTNTTHLHPVVRSLGAWSGAGTVFMSTMALTHPVTRRINAYLNKKVFSPAFRATRDYMQNAKLLMEEL